MSSPYGNVIITDPLADAFMEVKIKKIKIVLSKKFVTPGIFLSGLWPRVTLEYKGKERTIPMTHYANPTKAEAPLKYDNFYLYRDGIGGEILKLVGKTSKTKLGDNQQQYLAFAAKSINKQITSAINNAAKRKQIAKVHNRVQRKAITKRLEAHLQKFIWALKLKYGYIQGYEVARIWNDLMKIEAAREVHDC
jgi:hypothetical protein